MKNLPIAVLVLCTLQFACSTSSTTNPWNTFVSEDERRFVLQYPAELTRRIDRQNDSVALTTSNDLTFNDKPGDYFITIENAVSRACSNIGVSQPEIISEDPLILRGRVDAIPWDHDPPPQPSCMIGMPGVGGSPYTASYMLCSEKDGKQVAICVMQVTDDPDLANQIFDTFRWLE